ncbi:sugar ABC transporter permease [Rhodospirillum rubrum]|uniref:ABC transporter permease n=1 Tax=Rhodospirillum rubrum TaxID=1085 RepID=UPI0019073F02|nr:ABC transporter permease [Rhodospirillum rubrum]MBK1663676.1 sugar ABC transporter permease [Rhodospirillum rubrum]MBK1675994.1 sugar ABC transporter permease [Rhodospirillum rubrum]
MSRSSRFITLEARPEPSALWVWAAPLLAVGLTLIAGGLLFAALGKDPVAALAGFFLKPLSSLYGLGELGVKAAPLALIAAGLAVGFRGGVWNIGAEGQLTMGAVVGGGVGLALLQSTGPLVLPAMVICGALGGMAWAAIPALLRTRFNANEILTSLMLTYVAQLLLSWLVHGPWRSPSGFNFPETEMFGPAATLPVLIEGTRLHLGVVLALVVVGAIWVLLGRSFIGFQIKVMGLAPRAGAYAGFSQRRVIWMAMLLSGGAAGLAGLFEVAGPIGQLQPAISPGYGFTAIIVAFLGRLHPLGIVFAACFMALTYLGGETVQMDMGLPLAVTGVFQGMILFFLLAADVLIRYRIRLGRASSAKAL